MVVNVVHYLRCTTQAVEFHATTRALIRQGRYHIIPTLQLRFKVIDARKKLLNLSDMSSDHAARFLLPKIALLPPARGSA